MKSGCSVANGVATAAAGTLIRFSAVGGRGHVGLSDVNVRGVDLAVAIEIVDVGDAGLRRWFACTAAHVRLGHLGVGRRIAGVADGIAIIEDVVGRQPGVGVGQHRDLQPLVLDRVVGPGQFDARRSLPPAPQRTVTVGATVNGVHVDGLLLLPTMKTKSLAVTLPGRPAMSTMMPLMPLRIAGVVGEGRRLARQQRRLVGGDRRVVGRVGGRIVAVERRIVVEDVLADDVRLDQVFIGGLRRRKIGRRNC